MIASGKLDRRIFIQHATATQDAAGQVNLSYTGGIHVWASVKYDTGAFDIVDKKDTKVNKIEFTIRYFAALTKTSRIQFEGKTYLIEDIQPIGRNALLKIKAEERT